MSKTANHRKAVQTLTVRAVLAKYLADEALNLAVRDMRDAMRTGPQAWAFKPKADTPEDDRTYYQAGGYSI